DDARLRERRIKHPLRPEALEHAIGRTKNAALLDVFAEDDHRLALLHLFEERVVDRFDVRLRGHQASSAKTYFSASSGAGSGAASASFTASSISRLTCARSSRSSSSLSVPSSKRRFRKRSIGSRFVHSSTSARVRYRRSSSDEVCGTRR